MISRDLMIDAYMLNKKKVIAEMLYDTVTIYEERLKDALAQIKVSESKTCESCKYCDEYKEGEIVHCNYFEQFFPVEIGRCNKWKTR